jgi:glycosyltransferase involved in cell wall biosynthesis
MSAPRVSVVLPTYNRAATLPTAIRSVLDQTQSDLELIVVDDGSADGTTAVVEAIADPRLRYVRLDRRHGAAAARNAGIGRAKGELVAFQDSDDEWLPGKLESQVALLDGASPVGGVGGRYSVDDGPGRTHLRAPRLEMGLDYESELLDGPCCISPLWLIRRALLDELRWFDERMPCLEDWDLMLRLSERTELRAVPEEVLIKRGAGDSLGSDPVPRTQAMEELLRRHGRRFAAYPRRHAEFCLELSYLWLVRRRPRSALRCAAMALRGRGATPQMLRTFARACLRAWMTGHPAWPIPRPAEND